MQVPAVTATRSRSLAHHGRDYGKASMVERASCVVYRPSRTRQDAQLPRLKRRGGARLDLCFAASTRRTSLCMSRSTCCTHAPGRPCLSTGDDMLIEDDRALHDERALVPDRRDLRCAPCRSHRRWRRRPAEIAQAMPAGAIARRVRFWLGAKYDGSVTGSVRVGSGAICEPWIRLR